MKIYKAPVILWRDCFGNWYGRHLEPLPFMTKDILFACGDNRHVLVHKMITDLRKLLDNRQKADGSLKPIPERTFSWSPVSFNFRAVRIGAAGRFPDRGNTELTSLLVWRTDENGFSQATLPLENIEFSAFAGESIHALAVETLKRYYIDQPAVQGITRPAFFEPQTETLTVSLDKINLPQSSEDPDISLLQRVADPIDKSMRRQNYALPFGRKEDSALLTKRLLENQFSGTNLILCGPTGCGKSTLLVDAAINAQQMLKQQHDNKPPAFWRTNARRLMAGTHWLGEWQKQLAEIFKEIEHTGATLWIEDLAELINGSSINSTAAFFIPYLEEKRVRVIGETTPETLQVLGRFLPAFAEQFDVLQIAPMTAAQTVSAMTEFAKSLEAERKKIFIDESISRMATDLFCRFSSGRALPGPVYSFLKKSYLSARRQNKTEYGKKEFYDDFMTETGLPEWLFREEQTITREEIEQALARGVVGQPEAVHITADAILRFKAALNHPKKPIASLLFCGPTGVGKTQLVRTLAEYLFAGQQTEDRHHTSNAASQRLLRLDMSEYQFYGTAERMIERPDGRPGPLVEHIRREPFSVLLFDEIEKAGADTFDFLLNLLDEGRLTDRVGRTSDFRNTFVVMTSNLGTSRSQSGGFGDSVSDFDAGTACRKAVLDFFRPEFFNRIDELVVFHRLDRASCRQIAAMEIHALEKREGLASRRLRLQPTDRLIDRLAREGFHPEYGARPLRRAVEISIVPPLAALLQQTNKCGAALFLDWPEEKNCAVCRF